jgi:hypothetical protein
LEGIFPPEVHPLPVVFKQKKHPGDGDEVSEEDVGPEEVGVDGDVEDGEATDFSLIFSCGVVYGEKDDADDDTVEDGELETHLEEAEEHHRVEADVVDVELFGDPYCGHDPAEEL